MRKAERLIEVFPSFAHVTVAKLRGVPVTLGELVSMCKAGDSEACSTLNELGYDPPSRDEEEELAAHFWSKLPPNIKVYVLGYGSLTGEQIARLIKERKPGYQYFVDSYRKLLEVIRNASK